MALEPAPDVVTIMAERIVRSFDPLQIVLFGSHARGTSHPMSDVDLLVVFPSITDKRGLRVQIRKVLSDLLVSKDIFVTTPAEIERCGDMVVTFLRPALREVRVIYGRSRNSL